MKTKQSCTTILQIAYRFNQPQENSLMQQEYSVIGAGIAPCNHLDSDTLLSIHALHCAKQGNRRIMIRTVDTDVVVGSQGL